MFSRPPNRLVLALTKARIGWVSGKRKVACSPPPLPGLAIPRHVPLSETTQQSVRRRSPKTSLDDAVG